MPKPKNKTHGIMNFVYTYLIHQNILYLYRISLIKNIIQKVSLYDWIITADYIIIEESECGKQNMEICLTSP